MHISHKDLVSLFEYNADTGIFISRSGKEMAPIPLKRGYVGVRICGKNYRAHRAAWFYVYGSWPENQIDHINCIRDDNRI